MFIFLKPFLGSLCIETCRLLLIEGEGFWPCGKNMGLLQESWLTCWVDDSLLLRCFDRGRTPVVSSWSWAECLFSNIWQEHATTSIISEANQTYIHQSTAHTHTPKMIRLVIAQLLLCFFLSVLPVQPVSILFVTKMGKSYQSQYQFIELLTGGTVWKTNMSVENPLFEDAFPRWSIHFSKGTQPSTVKQCLGWAFSMFKLYPGSPVDQTKWLVFRMIHIKHSRSYQWAKFGRLGLPGYISTDVDLSIKGTG